MRRRDILSTAVLSGVLVAGCEGSGNQTTDSEPAPRSSEQTTNLEPAPQKIVEDIGKAAFSGFDKGVYVVPYVTSLDGAYAERSFARVNGEVSCSPVGEQREVDIEMLYAWDEKVKTLVQFEPPESEDQIFANFEGITEKTVQCAQFREEDGDISKKGVPVSGVFETGERKFVITPDDK